VGLRGNSCWLFLTPGEIKTVASNFSV
jgi:hypothetical protein